eukprot:Phypoly_transcript_05374.p1 GENE.Phypoly_transcript_05374~~Phypoly_transcript_05374.p1  ORF type:complete len:538 (+),score=161.40 Phypoly_transcript_05374:211-1824(+)
MIGEEEGKLPAYKLTAFGDEDILSYVTEKEISGQWSDEPFAVGRIMFLSMPNEHKNRISRKHFEIHCCTNEDTNEKEFWLIDKSANGTMIDGELGYLGKKTKLEDGSAIGFLLSVAKDHIMLGYSFSTPNGPPKKAPKEEKLGKPKGKPVEIGKSKGAGEKEKENRNAKQANGGEKANGKATDKKNEKQANGVGKVNGKGENTSGKEEEKVVFAMPAPKAVGDKANGKGGEKKTDGEKENRRGEEKANGKGEKETENGKGEKGVFAVPAPIIIKPKAKPGFMNGLRFSLIGYNEAALEDPKKKKLVQDLTERGATYVLRPEPNNVDVIVLSRNYFKDPASYDVNLQQLTSSLRVRFTSNTRWLEACMCEGRKVDPVQDEILPPKTGGVIVLDTPKGKGITGNALEPRVASQLASMLREEKRAVGARWKVIAPIAMIASCAGVLEGLESMVEVQVLKSAQKEGKRGEFMLGVREMHAAGYRHALYLVSTQEKDEVVSGMSGVEKVVGVVDGSGLTEFAQMLHAQRKEGAGQTTKGTKK